MTPRHASNYRPDIDGLRAIAMLGVVFYHFGLPGLNGGFVGVDVFFVISGFLIGRILWTEALETGRLRLAAFFARRIKRLFPAFAVMAIASAIAGYFILLPFEYREFGKSLIAATVYLSNLHFFREAGYFDTGSEDKILLHTWSLAVEEQFYIFLPLLILVFIRKLSVLRAVLWACFALSFVSSLWTLSASQPAAFYLFPFRAWELLAGVLLAIETQGRQFDTKTMPFLSVLGLTFVVSALILTPSGLAFPGIWAAVPVIGTGLLIFAGQSQSIVTTALNHPFLVGIGLISYSLYLWHWPVFTLGQYALGDLKTFDRVILLALSVVLAYLSWRFIEQPLRQSKQKTTTTLLAGLLTSIVLIALGGFIFTNDGLAHRFNGQHRAHIDATADFLQDWTRCRTPASGPFAGLEVCPIGPDQKPNILVWGDSHVRALKEGLEQLAFETNTPALLVWRAGCAPVLGLQKTETAATPAQDAACSRANDQMGLALQDGVFDKVLLVGRWGYYTGGKGTGRDASNKISVQVRGMDGDAATQFTKGLEATVQSLQQSGAHVAILKSIPEIANYDSRHISRALMSRLHSDRSHAEDTVAILRTSVTERAEAMQPTWARLSEMGVHLIDPEPSLCNATSCSALFEGVGQYFDNNHLTNSAARRLRHLFEAFWTAR